MSWSIMPKYQITHVFECFQLLKWFFGRFGQINRAVFMNVGKKLYHIFMFLCFKFFITLKSHILKRRLQHIFSDVKDTYFLTSYNLNITFSEYKLVVPSSFLPCRSHQLNKAKNCLFEIAFSNFWKKTNIVLKRSDPRITKVILQSVVSSPPFSAGGKAFLDKKVSRG